MLPGSTKNHKEDFTGDELNCVHRIV